MQKSEKNKCSGMVNISEKKTTRRVAKASCLVQFSPKCLEMLLKDGSPKGDVFETARVAGIMAAKQTPAMIPMCHPLALDSAKICFEVHKKDSTVHIFSEIVCENKTGVEMEALHAVSVAALTIYDMMKWVDREIIITDLKLIYKHGGNSGEYIRKL